MEIPSVRFSKSCVRHFGFPDSRFFFVLADVLDDTNTKATLKAEANTLEIH